MEASVNSDNGCLPTTRRPISMIEAVASELARLYAIVETLPKSADGVTITLGMRVYPEQLNDVDGFEDHGGTVESINADEVIIKDTQGEFPAYIEACPGNLYSTREAALAASKKK